MLRSVLIVEKVLLDMMVGVFGGGLLQKGNRLLNTVSKITVSVTKIMTEIQI